MRGPRRTPAITIAATKKKVAKLIAQLDDDEQISSPRAFAATVTTRLAINELRSARARREHYVGEWLPEPIITDGADDPARHAQIAIDQQPAETVAFGGDLLR